MKNKYKIGQEVFIINNDLEIVQKTIVGIVTEEKGTKYKLDENSCSGIEDKNIFPTKPKAEIAKKDFLDKLKFSIGDLIVYKEEDVYSNKKIRRIAKIIGIKYTQSPYTIKNIRGYKKSLFEKEIKLKLKNTFIENWGNVKELNDKYDKKRKELNKIKEEINSAFYDLEKKLSINIEKPYFYFSGKPKFEDRFVYLE